MPTNEKGFWALINGKTYGFLPGETQKEAREMYEFTCAFCGQKKPVIVFDEEEEKGTKTNEP
jgi:hypothetical protein